MVDRVRYAQHGDDILPEENHVTRVVLDLAKGCSYEENVTVTGDANLQAVVVTVKPPATGPAEPDPQPTQAGEPAGGDWGETPE